MQHHYGYIRGTIGRDKDHLDVFVKPGTPEDFGGSVYVVDQRKLGNGHFDEHKIMLGWDSLDDARAAYIENYDSHGPERIMGIKTLTFPEFKAWLNSGETTQPAAKMDEAAEPKTESATTMPAFTTAPSQEDAGASAAAEYKPGGWRVFDDKGTMIAQHQVGRHCGQERGVARIRNDEAERLSEAGL